MDEKAYGFYCRIAETKAIEVVLFRIVEFLNLFARSKTMLFCPKWIIVHHSLTFDGNVVDTLAIRKYHIETRGWRDIGYHAIVEKTRGSYEALYGRSLLIPGAHTIGYNRKSLGVCCVGNFNEETIETEMLEVLVNRVIKPWMSIFGILPENVRGHKELARDRTCPGEFFDLNNLRAMLE